jgi:hypothetical protein
MRKSDILAIIVERETLCSFSILMEDETFAKMFHKVSKETKGNEITNGSKVLINYVNENLIYNEKQVSITKKHLNQLAKIVATLHSEVHFSKDMQSIVIVNNLITSFAESNCENFDYGKWSRFIAKQIELDKKQEEKTNAFIQSLRKKTA